ncbi:MAG: hypothetical protein J6W27_04465 [Alphaproteobacteria bacterium]|nr:hypothetical protein [Alphaproteobacteria bacterium]
MAVEMDDFLKKYYRRLHTSAMPGEVLDRLMDNKKKGILTGHQQEWFEEFLELDPNDPEGKKYKAKDVPELRDTAELDPDELVKLYKRFAMAISGMKAASKFYDTVNDSEALAFIKKWFDDRQLFSIPKATDKCKNSINNILDLLENSSEAANLKQKIVDLAKKDNGDKLFNNIAALDKLLKKCRDGKYDSDADVQDKIKRVARALQDYQASHYYIDNTNSSTNRIVQEINTVSDDLENVVHEDAFSEIEVTPKNLEDFREIYGNEILETLYRDKNVRKKFGEKDPKFVEIIEKAEGKIAWHDKSKDDYVKPKVEDVLTPLQQLEKWGKDKYSDTLKKYEELRGGHVFFSPHAKEICKAIDKEKVKPTDGLKGLLDKADAIKKRFNSKTLDQHFDWFVQTMNDVKNDIPKAIDGAWKDARQMKCVITQIILRATDPANDDPDAMAKAKTAMEIMTVMKYGMLTSNVMDAFRKQEFSMFSDGKLSWNKNEGIQFVTKAFDRGLKAAFTGIGYGITFAHNKIHLAGGKFKNKNNDRNKAKDPLSARFAEEQARIARTGKSDKNLLNQEIQTAQHEINSNQQILDGLKSKGFDSDAHIQEQKDKLKLHDDRIKVFEKAKEQQNKIKQDHVEDYNKYEANLQTIQDNENQIKAVDDKISSLQQQKQNIVATVQQKRDELQNKNYVDPVTGQPIPASEIPAHEAQLNQEIQQLLSEYSSLDPQIKEQQDYKNTDEYKKFGTDIADLRTANARLQASHDAYVNADNQIPQIDQQINQYKINNGYDELNDNVNKFTEASEALEEQQKTLEDRQNALKNWDQEHVNKVVELENFWNFLQSGKTTTWRFSLEKQQKKFDANKMALYNQFVNDHGMAA